MPSMMGGRNARGEFRNKLKLLLKGHLLPPNIKFEYIYKIQKDTISYSYTKTPISHTQTDTKKIVIFQAIHIT